MSPVLCCVTTNDPNHSHDTCDVTCPWAGCRSFGSDMPHFSTGSALAVTTVQTGKHQLSLSSPLYPFIWRLHFTVSVEHRHATSQCLPYRVRHARHQRGTHTVPRMSYSVADSCESMSSYNSECPRRASPADNKCIPSDIFCYSELIIQVYGVEPA